MCINQGIVYYIDFETLLHFFTDCRRDYLAPLAKQSFLCSYWGPAPRESDMKGSTVRQITNLDFILFYFKTNKINQISK